MRSLLKKAQKITLNVLNEILPKRNRVIIVGFPNVESGAIEVANYIALNLDVPVIYVISEKLKDNPKDLLAPGVSIYSHSASYASQLDFMLKLATSKYIFMTHGLPFLKYSNKQTVVNLWHGLLYKKVGKLIGGRGVPAHLTVGTSPLTKTMLSEAFGVEEESVFISGYPRNDALVRAKKNKSQIKIKLGNGLETYKKVIIWMPTFRQKASGERNDGKEVDNPFYIENFDVEKFNALLAVHNSYCIVKPHPMAVKYNNINSLSHLKFIDDQWVSNHNISLYDLLGSSDILISDVSSVVIDYLLLDQPIVCVSTDFKEYKKTRGFYFNNIEEWLPNLQQSEKEFMNYLELLLATDHDPYALKRQALKREFFTHHDEFSTKRLIQHVFKTS